MSQEFQEYLQWDFLEPLRESGYMDEIGLVIIGVCFVITCYRALKASKDRNAAKKEAERLKAEGIDPKENDNN